MEFKDILKCLPHRYPFMLIDRVVQLEVEKKIIALKNVSFNEQFFQGHFPDYPVMPGVLIIEAMAQACCLLALKTAESRQGKTDGIYLFASIEDARFKRAVVPGDQLQLDVDLVKGKRDVWKFTGSASVDGHLVCTANLTSVRRDM
jgi:3-hydroxyacyl-[acyl-carrier-protein] dehydratase